MSRQWYRRITGMVLAVVAVLAISIGQAKADPILVHESMSWFYSTGGTDVVSCMGLGCSAGAFSIGDISGTKQWGLRGQAFTDGGNMIFKYAIGNSTLVPPISSFHIANTEAFGVGGTPTGWNYSQTGAWFSYETNNPPVYGLAAGDSKSGFSVTLDEHRPVIFNEAMVTTSDGGTTTLLSSGTGQWLVAAPGAPVPEPASLLLLGSGLAGFGAWRRRK